LRDPIEDLLAELSEAPIEAQEWGPELIGFTTEALREELERRGG
jgi:hypothetical protein